jgi:hypothetical protein
MEAGVVERDDLAKLVLFQKGEEATMHFGRPVLQRITIASADHESSWVGGAAKRDACSGKSGRNRPSF